MRLEKMFVEKFGKTNFLKLIRFQKRASNNFTPTSMEMKYWRKNGKKDWVISFLLFMTTYF
jgi:hypothetical protein